MNVKPEELAWNDQGLIPAIVQDYYSKKTLMMAGRAWRSASGRR